MGGKKKMEGTRRRAFWGMATKELMVSGKARLRPRWSRVLIVLALLALFFWMGKSVALFLFFKHVRNYPEVRFTDMLVFPFNIDAYRARMGDYDVEQSKLAFERGEYYKSAVYAYTGVLRSPSNLEGRIYLSSLNLSYFRRVDQALETLRQGIPVILAKEGDYGRTEIDYMRFFCRVFLKQGEDEELRKVIEGFLTAVPGVSPMNGLLAMAMAQSLYLEGRFDEAARYLEEYAVKGTSEGILLRAKILWERGQKDEAIALIAQKLEELPEQEQLYQQIIVYFREEGRSVEALRYAELYTIRKPFSSGPRIMKFYVMWEQGRFDEVEAEVKTFIEQFGESSQAMELLGLFAADVGNVDLSRRLYEEALNSEVKGKSAFALLLLEAYIGREAYAEAEVFIQGIEKEEPLWFGDEGMADLFYGFHSIIYYALGDEDEGDYYFDKFIQSNRMKRDRLFAIAGHYRRVGKVSQANVILKMARERFPRDTEVLALLTKTSIDLGHYNELPGYLALLVNMRRPSLPLVEEVYRLVGGDRFLFLEEREQLLGEVEVYLEEQEKLY